MIKGFDFAIQFRIHELRTHLPSLRAEKSRGADGDAMDHVVANALKQFLAGGCAVGIRQPVVPARVLHEGLHQVFLIHVPVIVELQHAIDAESVRRSHERAALNVGLQGTGRADADHIQCPVFLLDLTCLQIDICHGIQLRHDNIYIIGTHTGGNHRDTFPFVVSCVGYQFSILFLQFH